MNKLILIHGFNVNDNGKSTIARLEPRLIDEDYEVEIFSYGWLGLMGVFYMNPRIVKQLVEKVSEGDIAVCHSNGCLIAHMAAKFGAPFKKLFYINPALNSNIPLAEHVESLHVVHTEHDNAVKMASWLRALAPWAPLGDSLWGDMGARGYKPGKYIDSDFNPKGLLNQFIHKTTLFCSRHSTFLNFFRIIFIPVVFTYWLALGPIELLLTYYRNNLASTDKSMGIDLSRKEDNSFVVNTLIVPITIWSIVGIFTFFI